MAKRRAYSDDGLGPTMERLMTETGLTYRAPRKMVSMVQSGIDWFDVSGLVSYGDLDVPVEALLAAEPPSDVTDLVVRRAEGNHFFVEELLGTLIDRGLLEHGIMFRGVLGALQWMVDPQTRARWRRFRRESIAAARG